MKHFLTFAFIMLATTVWGIPAKRTTRVVKQPDGTQITLTLRGDEWLHYHALEDGTPMQLDEATGWWRPMTISDEARRNAIERHRESSERRAARMQARRAVTRGGSDYNGNKHGIVILAEFNDKGFVLSNPKSLYNDVFNKHGYSDYGMGGSVRDYFYAQSYGKLDITFDVVGPVRLPKDMAYYGGRAGSSNDAHPGEFAGDAIQLAEKQGLVDNWTKYDWDGDGLVDQVFIIYAGYGEAQSGHADEIWPHEWTLYSANYYKDGPGPLEYDGVIINTYACGNELNGSRGTKVDGIGTACHEFSHCLGLPDMYDTGDEDNFGMGAWDVMDSGSYNADGYVPASYTAFERWSVGWVEPVVLDEGCFVTGMKNIDEDGECYVIFNRAHDDEFYMLQNIQRTGWNIDAPTSGMLVIHVNYDEEAWYRNQVNTEKNNQHVSPVCADNKWGRNDVTGDLWPYGSRNALTDNSSPAAKLFHPNDDGRKYLGRPITDIKHENGLISFTFNGGTPIAVPQPAVSSADGRAIVSWPVVENADNYGLRLYEEADKVEELMLISTDFALLTAEKDGSADKGSSLSSCGLEGWTGEKVYVGVNGAKLGSSKAQGYLQTPAFEVHGSLKVHIKTAAYSLDTPTAKLEIVGGESRTVELGKELNEVFSDLNGTVQVRFTPTKRGYISLFEAQTTSDPMPLLLDCTVEQAAPTATAVQYTLPVLVAGNTYYVEVQSRANDGRTSAWSRLLTFVAGRENDAVASVRAAADANVIYDMQGRRVTAVTRPGLYIVNGRKMCVMP